MTHVAIENASATVRVQDGAVVSKVIHRDERLDVTVFGFGAGEGLTEHRASRPAIVHVLSGRLRVFADGQDYDARPGFWLHMTAGTPHAMTAEEPTLMLLTLVRED
jgi:quercetin dioxygenase-like cupin family protein